MAKTTRKAQKPAAPGQKKLGPHLAALITLMRGNRKRKKPLAVLAKTLKSEMPDDLRALLSAWSEHEQPHLAVGDYWLDDGVIGDQLPDGGSDLLAIGVNGGGDVWVVAAPPCKRTRVTCFLHEEQKEGGDSYKGLEAFLASRFDEDEGGLTSAEYRAALEHARPKAKAKSHALVIARDPKAPRITFSAKAAATAKKEGAVLEDRAGGYAIGVRKGETAWQGKDRTLLVVDEGSGRIVSKKAPELRAYHYGHSSDHQRLLCAAMGGLYEVTLATGEAKLLLAASAGCSSACYLGAERIAVIHGLTREHTVQIYERGRRAGVQAVGRAEPCSEVSSVFAFAQGRLMLLCPSQQARPCYVMAIHEGEVRPVGDLHIDGRAAPKLFDICAAFDADDGRSFLIDWRGERHAVSQVDAAVERAFADGGGYSDWPDFPT